MKRRIISLMRYALRTLNTQWSIDIDHLETCKSTFHRFERFLNHEIEGIEEEHKDDGNNYHFDLTFRRSDGYYESFSGYLNYYNEPDPSLQLLHHVRTSKNEYQNYCWVLNFEKNTQLYSIIFDRKSGWDDVPSLLWGYKDNEKIQF